MVNVNAVASAASTLRSLFEVGIERVLPFFTFVVDNVASFGLALVDILIFLAFTVEMLTVRYDIINLLVDLLHPDNDRISAATATAMDGSGGGSARRKMLSSSPLQPSIIEKDTVVCLLEFLNLGF